MHKAQAFIPSSCSLKETQDYLIRVAFIKAAGRAVKLDDIASTLAEVVVVSGSWTIRRLLSENIFFVTCPSFKVVYNLLSLGQIHDFSLIIDYWDHIHSGTTQHKVAASLFNLPLVYWNIESVGNTLSSFGVSVQASKANTSWEDLTSFNISFF